MLLEREPDVEPEQEIEQRGSSRDLVGELRDEMTAADGVGFERAEFARGRARILSARIVVSDRCGNGGRHASAPSFGLTRSLMIRSIEDESGE